MFSKEFLNTLQKVNTYSDKVVLKYPITVLNSDSNDVIITINAQNLGCSEFENTGIYELSKFISMLGIFTEADVKREDKLLKIHSVTETAAFTLCDLDLLKAHDLQAELITNLDKYPSVSEFEFSANDLAVFKKASNVLNELNALKIEGSGGNTEVSLALHNRFNASSNEYNKVYLGTSQKDFVVKLGIENVQKLPGVDYTVKVKYNEEKDAYRVIFVNANFTILISKLADQ